MPKYTKTDGGLPVSQARIDAPWSPHHGRVIPKTYETCCAYVEEGRRGLYVTRLKHSGGSLGPETDEYPSIRAALLAADDIHSDHINNGTHPKD